MARTDPRPSIQFERHPFWKGDAAGASAKNNRARKLFPLPEKCDECDAPPIARHHIDEDPGNNDPSNIKFLCGRHHLAAHNLLGVNVKQPPKPCMECGRLTNPRTRGKCQACYRRELRAEQKVRDGK
jgi:hypothetical protein